MLLMWMTVHENYQELSPCCRPFVRPFHLPNHDEGRRSGNARQSFLNKNDNDDGDGEHYVNKFYSEERCGCQGDTGSFYSPFISCRSQPLLHSHQPPAPIQILLLDNFPPSSFPFAYYTFTITDKEGPSSVALALYKVLLNQVVNPQTRPPRLDQFSATSAIICAELE